MGLAVPHAAAADQQRALGLTDDGGRFLDDFLLGHGAGQPPDPLGKKALRIVVGFAFHVLGDSNAHGAGVGRIGEGPEGGNHGTHQLLRAHHTVPVAANGTEGVVGGEGEVVDLLNLLQNGVGLAAGVHVTGQNQHRDVVGSGGRGGSDHVGSAGAHGGGDGNDLFPLALPGKGHGRVGHALLVFALPDLETMGFLRQSLAQTYHIAVAGQHDDALHKGVLHPVIADVLILQEPDQSLGHGQSNGIHMLLLSAFQPLKIWSLASARHSQACSSSSMRVFFQGSPSRWRMPQA